MTKGDSFVQSLARELEPLARRILDHAFIKDAEAGRLGREKLRQFVKEQYHIITGDFRNLALYTAFAPEMWIQDFFLGVLNAERKAYDNLIRLGKAFDVSLDEMIRAEPTPGAFAFTNYFTRLATHGSIGQVASAMVLDLDVWGTNCHRLSEALRKRYGLKADDTGYLDAFYPIPPEFRDHGIRIIECYLKEEGEERKMRESARLTLEYELMFWDTVHGG